MRQDQQPVTRGLFAVGLFGTGAPADPTTPAALPGAPEHSTLPGLAATPFSSARALPSRAPIRRRVPSMRPYRGAYVRPIPAQGELRDLAWGATLRRVAPRRRVPGGLTIQLRPDDLLRKLRMQRPRRLLLLVVDVSGSMGGALMDLARRTALGLLDQAYLDRDPVAMIAFCQRSAELLLPPTRHAAQVPRALVDLTCGGTTPLAAGLQLAERTLLAHARREAAPSAALLLISDGRANVGAHPGQAALDAELKAVARRLSRTPNLQRIFVDTTAAGQDDHAARWLATQLHADRHLLWQLQQRSPDPARTLAQELIRALR